MVTFSTRIIGNILTPILNFPANYFLDKYGLKFGVLIANVASLAALWISTLAGKNFLYLLVGQVFAAVGHAFLLSVPQKVSVVWFAPDERVMSTTIMAMSILVGNAVGAQFPNFFVDNDASGEEGKKQVYNMLFFMAILGSVLLAPTFLLFKNKPKIPPSKAAEAKSVAYMKSLIMLMKNGRAMVLIIGGSLIIGTNMTIAAVLQLLLKPFNFQNADVGYYITFSIVLGLPSSLLVGYIVNKTKKYKATIVSLGVGATLSLVAIMFAAKTENAIIMGVAFCLFGFIVNPLYPITVELLCEMSYPVAEVMVGGIFYTLSQVLGTGESFGADALLEGDSGRDNAIHTFYLMIIVDVVGVLLLLATKQTLKRSDFENSGAVGVSQERPSLESDIDYERNRISEQPSYNYSKLD